MEVKVTKPQVKKMLEKHGEVEINLFERGKDPNHYMTTIFQATIKDMSELDDKLPEAFKKAFGHKNFSMAIWKDTEEDGE